MNDNKITIYLSDDLLKLVEAMAKIRHWSNSQTIRFVVEKYFKK